ncbi:MAG: CoA-transferase [Planctomycetota bacterium]
MAKRELTSGERTLLERAGREVKHGMVVNLGIGLPQFLPEHLPANTDVTFHSENGFVGMGEGNPEGTPDSDVIDAGGRACKVVPGAAFFDSLTSFALVRGGNLDLAVLGAFEVSLSGDLANWKIPGKLTPGMGGGMELAQKANHVLVISHHLDKRGRGKLVPQCSLPLTAPACVGTLVTERAVFRRIDGRMHLASIHPDFDRKSALEGIDADVPTPDVLEPWEATP